MDHNYFWLSERQFARLARFFPWNGRMRHGQRLSSRFVPGEIMRMIQIPGEYASDETELTPRFRTRLSR